jgi:hypothetical protein
MTWADKLILFTIPGDRTAQMRASARQGQKTAVRQARQVELTEGDRCHGCRREFFDRSGCNNALRFSWPVPLLARVHERQTEPAEFSHSGKTEERPDTIQELATAGLSIFILRCFRHLLINLIQRCEARSAKKFFRIPRFELRVSRFYGQTRCISGPRNQTPMIVNTVKTTSTRSMPAITASARLYLSFFTSQK